MRREVGMKREMMVCAGGRGDPATEPPSPFSNSSSDTRRSPLLNCFVSSRRSYRGKITKSKCLFSDLDALHPA